MYLTKDLSWHCHCGSREAATYLDCDAIVRSSACIMIIKLSWLYADSLVEVDCRVWEFLKKCITHNVTTKLGEKFSLVTGYFRTVPLIYSFEISCDSWVSQVHITCSDSMDIWTVYVVYELCCRYLEGQDVLDMRHTMFAIWCACFVLIIIKTTEHNADLSKWQGLVWIHSNFYSYHSTRDQYSQDTVWLTQVELEKPTEL